MTTNLLETLGFILNQKKCVLNPAQRLEFLGFQVDISSMTLSLPVEKIKKINKECRYWLHTTGTSPRQLACLIGFMTSTSPAVLLSPLHYKMLQMLHSQSLSRSQHKLMTLISPEHRKAVRIFNSG